MPAESDTVRERQDRLSAQVSADKWTETLRCMLVSNTNAASIRNPVNFHLLEIKVEFNECLFLQSMLHKAMFSFDFLAYFNLPNTGVFHNFCKS